MRKPTMRKHGDPQTPPRRPYRAPELKVHGDFRKLTAAKGGNMGDGSGKPSTRSSGPGA
jgi:hypothetical protein